MKLAFFIAVLMSGIVSLPCAEIHGAGVNGVRVAQLAESVKGIFYANSYATGKIVHDFDKQVEILEQLEKVVTRRLALIRKYADEVGSDAFDGKIRMKTDLKSPYLEFTLIHTNYTREDYEVSYGNNINEMVYVANLNYVVDYQIFGTLEGMRLFFLQKMADAVNQLDSEQEEVDKEITALQRLYSTHVDRILAVTKEIGNMAHKRRWNEFRHGDNQWSELSDVVTRMNNIRDMLTDSLKSDEDTDTEGLIIYDPELSEKTPKQAAIVETIRDGSTLFHSLVPPR